MRDDPGRLTIRAIDAREGPDARDLVLHILNHEYGLALTLEELPDLVDIHRTYRQSGSGNFWIACDGARIVGCIGVLQLAGEHYELRRMYVEAGQRGRGIAQGLLDTVFDWSARHGIGHLWLETNAAWHAAHHIYEKHGFTPVDRDRLPPQFPIVRVATGFYHRAMQPVAPRPSTLTESEPG